MKSLLLRSSVLAIVLINLLFGMPAQAVTAAPATATQAVFSLTDLGAQGDIVMRGPFESTSLRYDLPPTWALQDGAQLRLSISLYVDYGVTIVQGQVQPGTVSGALLDVFFNGRLQQSVPLTTGENMLYTVPISANALPSPYPDGRMQITFSLNASHDCQVNQHTTIKIAGSSQTVLPYTEVPLRLDLRRLPWPIYQARAQKPGQAALVFPAKPTASQMNAALLVMGAFGRMTNSQLHITMITADQLSNTYQASYDLIFVGPASAFPMLSSVDFPVRLQGGYASTDMKADDGIIEMAASPWNNEKSLLVVGGNSDAGLVKAARALTTGTIQTATKSTYSIIADVNPSEATGIINAASLNTSSDYTLSQLGYEVSTGVGEGTVWFTYNFVVPAGQVVGAGPYLSLIYSYSTLVDPGLSSADVYLNNQRVGSITLDQSANSAKSQVPLPASLMRPGSNIIEIAAGLLPKDACSTFSPNDLWITVFPDSILHLPLSPAPSASDELTDLKSFPKPFSNDPSLGGVVFVLPQADARAWAQAGQVAFSLGSEATGSAFAFNTAFDGKVPTELQGGDLIVVGLPSQLSILNGCKDACPAYFEAGSNVAVLASQEVVYRVPSGKNLGYLQLFASPWDTKRAVLGVLGTTPDGVDAAGSAISATNIRDSLRGNFATVDGTQVTVVDTRTGFGLGRLEPVISAAATSVAQGVAGPGNNGQAAVQSADEQKRLVLSSFAGVLLLIAVVVAITLWVRRRSLTHKP